MGENTNNSNGPGMLFESSVSSTIKYADIINSNVDNYEWMIRIDDGSTIENSNISGGRTRYIHRRGSLINSKIHSFTEALEMNSSGNSNDSTNTSSVTGNEFYDNQLDNTNQPQVQLYGNSIFKNNRIFTTSNTTKNFALRVGGDVTIENNTIGGSTGQHGAVGISIPYNYNATIRNNNIGGHQANVVVHGYGSGSQQYTFTNNTFIGTLSGNQRHVVVYDGNNKTDWHNTNIPNYDENGEGN